MRLEEAHTDSVPATPAPSTKHLTDEELKQQYGIHLTSRLQADAEGKEAKWADIDDDEDDWAPETIEWNDGTKTTLAASDLPSAVATPSSEMPPPTDIKQADATKPVPPQFISSVGPNATVLKLGASAEKQMAQKAAAEKTRSPLEKPSRPSPSNTTPAPPPTKSPWAALPPVDKVSPIEIAPQPVMPPSNRFGPGYGYAPGSVMQAPSPAREMSADDFNRAWREGQSNQPRELFMPNSGRYEAVSDGRRRMSRNDQGFRAPAVLQRPSGTDQSGPAEPSAAFQTTRTSSDVNRRRASSIVSGGSGQIARRLSIKSGDLSAPVFDNMSSDVSVRPTSRDGPRPHVQTPAYQARHPSTDMATGGSAFDIEAEREKQKQMMKESGARARQRRLEEEARLEAEKQERIKKKLAALEAAAPQAEQKPATSGEQPEASLSEQPEQDLSAQQQAVETPRLPHSSVQAASQSPPKPPQPLATGEPQQYGMIKVHALDSTKKMGMMEYQRPFASMRSDGSELPNGQSPVRPLDNQRSFAGDAVVAPEPSPKLPKPAQGPNGVSRGWGELPTREHRGTAAGNLWGISSNKALGNGTFDQSLAGYAPQDLSRTPSGAPAWSNGRTPVAGRSPHVAEARLLAGTSLTSPDQGPLAADSEADTLFPVVRPAPIGPPQQQSFPTSQSMTNSPMLGNSTSSALAGWNNFHSVAAPQERAENERISRENAARKEEEQRTGIRRGPQYTFSETWKQVQVGDQPTQRDNSGISQSSIPASSFGAVGSTPTGPAQRGSRFFPSASNFHAPEGQRAATYSYPMPPRSPSPPPAEDFTSSHPAFDGDIRHPAVRFPREKAVVKLPPMSPPTPPAEAQEGQSQLNQPMTWAARAAMAPPAQLRHASMPIAQTPSWQERFNGLFDKKAAGQRGIESMAEPSPAVETSTRELLDVLPPVGASVSLPSVSSGLSLVEDFSAISREVEEEEDLFEDRELASLPTISLPLQPLVTLPLAQTPRFFHKPVEVASMDVGWVPYGPGAQYAIVRPPGATKMVKVNLPIKPITNHGPSKFGKPFNKRGSNFGRGGKTRGTAKAA